MRIKKYVLLFIVNSFLWFLLYWATEVVAPDKSQPTGIWDLNMNGFILGLILFFGIHLIPFYLVCIKNISGNKLKFFLLNLSLIIVFNPLVWLTILNIQDSLSNVFSTESLIIYLIHGFVFTIIFFIKNIYYKTKVTP